jgi:hypothetical protein
MIIKLRKVVRFYRVIMNEHGKATRRRTYFDEASSQDLDQVYSDSYTETNVEYHLGEGISNSLELVEWQQQLVHPEEEEESHPTHW